MGMQARITEQGYAVVPAVDAVKAMFPEAVSLSVSGQSWLALDHNPSTTFILRKLGYEVPPPSMHYKYPGPDVPFSVQRDTVAHLVMHQRAYVLNDMGTGKTKSTLWAWDYLYSKGLTGKLIVFAPLSTLSPVWAREILTMLSHRKCRVVHSWSRANKVKALDDRTADIYIINHDGHKSLFAELMRRPDINHVVIDELAVYRNPGAERTKAMQSYCASKGWVWALTGSPTPTSPLDVFAQAKIVTPHTVPSHFRFFRDELMYKVSAFKWVPKANAIEKAFAVLQPAVRYTLDDVVELPEIVERFVDIPMNKVQSEIYKRLHNAACAMVAEGAITAANAGGVMSKLLQIACGWVYTENGDVAVLENKDRIDALCDAIDATGNKILVFATFKHAVDGIESALDARGYKDVAVVTGDTPVSKRNDIFNLFQNTDRHRILLAHPQCLAHGITLTRADTIVWFCPTTNLEIYDQANRRIRRIGQKHKQLILHFQGSPVEKRVYSLLAGKQINQSTLLQMFREAV